MQPKRNSNTASIGELFAANLFPDSVNNTLRERNALRKDNVTPRHAISTRISRATFTQNLENHTPVIACFPFINKEAFNMTMNNYRAYVDSYNKRIKSENAAIKNHNNQVYSFRRDNVETLTDVQKEFSRLFVLKNIGKKSKEYNEAADQFNNEYGLLIEKKTYQTIKYATELVFQQMLFLYSVQLSKASSQYMQLGVSEPAPVKQMNINSWQVATCKRNEINAIDICKATVRNHRTRLEEAGILVDYLFKGHKTGLKMNINSQILVVFDAKLGRFSNAENQHLTPKTCKVLADKEETTGTSKNNIKKRENGKADFLELGTPTAVPLSVLLQEHPPQDVKGKNPAREKNVKIHKDFSDHLEKRILHPQELAEKLAAGQFNNYQRMDKRLLYREAAYGTLTREDFKQLIIQEFFCNAAKLYRGKNVFTGSWKKAINSYIEKLFFVNNGNDLFLYNKELMVDKLQEMLWRLNNAQKWFQRAKINPLFPSEYFDFTRIDKKEIGFEYTKTAYKNHLKYLESKPKLLQKVKKNAEIRKATINHSKKFEAKLNSFFKNRLSLNDLIDYTSVNLPPVYLQKLSEIMLKISTKYTC